MAQYKSNRNVARQPAVVPTSKVLPGALIDAASRGELTKAQARELYNLGSEVVVLALLAASKRITEQDAQIAAIQSQTLDEQVTPSTPSGMVPVYKKANKSGRRRPPGARPGHPGTRRVRPTKIDERRKHRLKRCPECNGPLQRCNRMRTRIIEDIPEEIGTVATEHTVHRDYCPRCKKHVEPVVPDALPKATIGHRLVSLTSWLHYGLGVTIAQIVSILSFHLHTKLTPGGLVAMWQRVATILESWYQQIAEQARDSAYLHADETGWRVNGKTHWLWCFTNTNLCFYMIDRSRGSPALQKFFIDSFEGILITDFWRAYDSVCAADRQFCLVHLLRELEKVDLRNDSKQWRAFAKKLRRLIRDAIRLRKRKHFTPKRYASRIQRIYNRSGALADQNYRDKDATRLAKRLRRVSNHLWTFLNIPMIPFDNNFAERQIRPAVILRKNNQSNRSDKGAATQAILMSVYRTLRLRKHDPAQTIAHALKTYMATGELPPLPDPAVADG